MCFQDALIRHGFVDRGLEMGILVVFIPFERLEDIHVEMSAHRQIFPDGFGAVGGKALGAAVVVVSGQDFQTAELFAVVFFLGADRGEKRHDDLVIIPDVQIALGSGQIIREFDSRRGIQNGGELVEPVEDRGGGNLAALAPEYPGIFPVRDRAAAVNVGNRRTGQRFQLFDKRFRLRDVQPGPAEKQDPAVEPFGIRALPDHLQDIRFQLAVVAHRGDGGNDFQIGVKGLDAVVVTYGVFAVDIAVERFDPVHLEDFEGLFMAFPLELAGIGRAHV